MARPLTAFRYSFDANKLSVALSRVAHSVIGCLGIAVASVLAGRQSVWLVAGIAILSAVVWPYIAISAAVFRDSVRRTVQVTLSGCGVATVATLTEPGNGWIWGAVVAGGVLAMLLEAAALVFGGPGLGITVGLVEAHWQALLLVGLVAGVIGTAAVAVDRSSAWYAALILTIVIAIGEAGDSAIRSWGASRDELNGEPGEKIIFVISVAGLMAAAAWAASELPLVWVWIGMPLVAFLQNLEINYVQVLGGERIGDVLPEKGFRHYEDPV